MNGQGGLRLVAVDAAAAAQGLAPGMMLGDARSLVPHVHAAEADAAGDAAALDDLADWCTRYSPWAATDGADGICIDVSGVAHLFGGEATLIADLRARLARAGIVSEIAIADTAAAAWALARFGRGGVVPPGGTAAAVSPLPSAALRLPADVAADLERLGLGTVADVARLPRGPLAARFGAGLLERLDRILGHSDGPISPRHPPAAWRTRMNFAEPVGRPEDVALTAERLLERLCVMLGEASLGARRLVLACYRVDGDVQRVVVGTSRPVRAPVRLMRLFRDKLGGIDPGFGIETMLLEAGVAEALPASQADFAGSKDAVGDDLAALVDRLQNRLGPAQVVQLAPCDSHEPVRVVTVIPALSRAFADEWPVSGPRPVRLLPSPEPIEATAPVPDDPPVRFRWRRVDHRVVRADGPERIAPEWWREDRARRSRDYYRIEDEAGRRFWVYRDGAYRPGQPPRWYLHGLFA